jgi:hypothetical protein
VAAARRTVPEATTVASKPRLMMRSVLVMRRLHFASGMNVQRASTIPPEPEVNTEESKKIDA